MEPFKTLDRSHPSFGCNRALFIFFMDPPKGKRRMVLVEAHNANSVALLERLSIRDQRVSQFCSLGSVVRDFTSVGTRSDEVIEVSIPDFVLDFVDRNRLIDDMVSMTLFRDSLSDSEREYVENRLSQEEEMVREESVLDHHEFVNDEIVEMPVPEAKKSTPKRDYSLPLSALKNLGFSKKEIDAWASKFNFDGLNDSDIIKFGCQALSGVSK